MSKAVLDLLKERFGDAILSTHDTHGDDTAVVDREKIVDIVTFLKEDPAMDFNFAVDITAVDWYGNAKKSARFEVVYHLYSIAKKHRIRLKAAVPEEDAVIDSIVPLYSGMNWFEREVWDMYGIKFRNHPDLRRIFMWKTFEGHALRKDYPKDKRQPLARREGVS
jgi:NADH-quinone oxidoreductase subunit C